MNKISAGDSFQFHFVNQTGYTYFPAKKQIASLIFILMFQLEALIIKIPIQTNTPDLPFLISEILLFLVIIYSWYETLSIDPSPKDDARQLQFANFQEINRNKLKSNINKFEQQICKICRISKNETTQHCKQCNRCVQDFYFHSRWLNSCIGKANYSAFISMIIFIIVYEAVLFTSNLVNFNHRRTATYSQDNQKQMQTFFYFTKILNQLFLVLTSILLIVTLIFVFVMRKSFMKHKIKNRQSKKIMKSIELKKVMYGIWQKNQKFSETNSQIDSIRQLQSHQNSLHSVSYEEPALFKTNFFSASSYLNHKKQSLQVKSSQMSNQMHNHSPVQKCSKSNKSYSRQYSDSFQARNLQLEQLFSIQKIKQSKRDVHKTSKFKNQKKQESLSIDLIKTKPQIHQTQKQNIFFPTALAFKIIKGKRQSISKINDVITQKRRRKKLNLFAIKKRQSLKEEVQRVEHFHRPSNLSK